MKQGAAAMLKTPGVIASYWRDGGRFRLRGTNAMTVAEMPWWKRHGQELVNTMAASNGPDVIGLLHDKTSYGVYGDHGGAQESVQRVPMVFWSPSLAYGNNTYARFTTPDVMPTILRADGDPGHRAGGRGGAQARRVAAPDPRRHGPGASASGPRGAVTQGRRCRATAAGSRPRSCIMFSAAAGSIGRCVMPLSGIIA